MHEKEPHGADQIMGANHHAGGIRIIMETGKGRHGSLAAFFCYTSILGYEIFAPRRGRCVGDMGIDGLHALHCLTTGLGHHLSVGARRKPIMDASHAVWLSQVSQCWCVLECYSGVYHSRIIY